MLPASCSAAASAVSRPRRALPGISPTAIEAPLVLDADGLNAHAEQLEGLSSRTAPTVMTPHAGELGRLLGLSSEEISSTRLACARKAAEGARAVVVLKGDDTLIVDGSAGPGGDLAVNVLSSPALATAGTGDVLGGMIAALIARGIEPFAAACAAVLAHSRAGRIAAERVGSVEVGDRLRRDRCDPRRTRALKRALATVDVGAVERNCARIVAGLDEGASLCAVVKADGYGHGAVDCARAAIRGGASYLAVATAGEAVELRRAFPERLILTMGALTEQDLDTALLADSEIAVWNEDFLRLVERRAGDHGVVPKIHVKHDSGMGRLGESDPDQVVRLCDTAGGVEVVGLWTHYATADEADTGYLEQQIERFTAVVERVRAIIDVPLVHASNSAATLGGVAPDLDMVRCGVAIYGLDPFQEDPAARDLEPAMSLRSYVAAVKRFSAGASAGYGRRWVAERETWVGVLPIGYADGVRRDLTNNGDVLIGGRRRPIVGTVSMDNLTVDLGPDTDVEVGAEAVLIGGQGASGSSPRSSRARLGTINYEVATGIGPRVPRRYDEGRRLSAAIARCPAVIAVGGGGSRGRRRDGGVDRRRCHPGRRHGPARRGRRSRRRRGRGARDRPGDRRRAGRSGLRALERVRDLARRLRRPLLAPRRNPAARRDDRGRPGAARLHRQRDGLAAGDLAAEPLGARGGRRPTSRRG